jgi:hypothetical protein
MAIVMTQIILRITDAWAGFSGNRLKPSFNVLFSHLTATRPITIIANAIMTCRPCSTISGISRWSLSSSSIGLILILLTLKKTFELELCHTSDNHLQFVGTLEIGAPDLSPVSVKQNSIIKNEKHALGGKSIL